MKVFLRTMLILLIVAGLVTGAAGVALKKARMIQA